MALSFEESLRKAKAQEEAAAAIVTFDLNDEKENTIEVEPKVYAVDSWTLDNKYLYYPEYHDDRTSTIDDKKNVILDSSQINITQESNSQFIPFEMPRYYDGFDIQGTQLLIHYVNKDGYEDFANPINVFYSDSKIRFAWLVDKKVTAIEGKVQFEIHAIGANSKGDEYCWKTKPCDGLNI